MKTHIIKGIILFLSLSAAVSCMDWLDVRPKTSISEEELFSREEGFMEALTGIYIQLSGSNLYGRELSYGFPDILAQRYEPGGNTDRELAFVDPDWYKFPSTLTEGKITAIWRDIYNTIANINNLIKWVDANGDVISTPGYRDIIKGEALGLRAFLYTELLRMYGPIYKDNRQSPTLPYRTEFNREDKALSTAEEITAFIEKDISEAESLLIDDPMYMEFPTAANPETVGLDEFLVYRYKRMNLYAVKALAARMYMWKGDKVNAAKYAGEVINGVNEKGEPYFRLVTNNATDRIFSTELLFSVSVDKLEDQVEIDFAIAPHQTDFFVMDKTRIDEIFDTRVDGTNDMRYREGQGFSFTAAAAFTVKYRQSGAFSTVLYNTIPIIRLSEMYYILAECTADLEEARELLSTVREARGVDQLRQLSDEEDRINEVMKEYRKEFYAEGQLWYFYKRHGYKTFLHCPLDLDMTEANYRFSLPENEIEFGNY